MKILHEPVAVRCNKREDLSEAAIRKSAIGDIREGGSYSHRVERPTVKHAPQYAASAGVGVKRLF